MCYADFCDVFRCKGFVKILNHRKKRRNFRGSFTRILGSKEALYDLGINVHDEEEFNLYDEDPKNGEKNKNALMTMPPRNVLRALDKDQQKDDRFVVGLDVGQNVQDPYEFGQLSGKNPDMNPDGTHRGSRPRGGSGTGNDTFSKLEQRQY